MVYFSVGTATFSIYFKKHSQMNVVSKARYPIGTGLGGLAQLFRVRPSDVIAWENGHLQPDEEQMENLERLRDSGAKKMRFKFN